MHQESEVVGHEAMATEPVTGEAVLEFLVTIFAFASLNVVVVADFGQRCGARTIGDHKSQIGAKVIALRFGDHESMVLPTLGSIEETIE